MEHLQRRAHLRLTLRGHARVQRGFRARADVPRRGREPSRVPVDDVDAREIARTLAVHLARVAEHLRRLGEITGGGGGGAGGRDAAHGLFQSLRELQGPDDAMEHVHRARDVLELAGLGAHRAMGLHDLLAHATHRVLKGVHASSDDLQDAIRLVHAAELGEKVVVVRAHLRLSAKSSASMPPSSALVAAWTVPLASISLAYAVTSKSSLRKGARRGSPCEGGGGGE